MGSGRPKISGWHRAACRIRNLADFGAFVEIEEGLEGLIHISDVSWTERIKHPSEKFKKGDTVEAKVLKVDRRTAGCRWASSR